MPSSRPPAFSIGNLPPDFTVPEPTDSAALLPDELPLDAGDGSEELLPPLDDGDENGGPPGAA